MQNFPAPEIPGERTEQLLPVVQIKESHGLKLDSGAVSNGATCVIAPYQAMRVDDIVTLIWRGFYSGDENPLWKRSKTIKAEDIGQPLMLSVDEVEVLFSETADVYYEIKYAGGQGRNSVSAVQTFTITPPDIALLPPIKIKGYNDGPLNPNLFRNGLTAQITPLYSDMCIDDRVLLHFTGSRPTLGTLKLARVDASTVDSGVLELNLEQDWLLKNIGAAVTFSYQYARGGVAQSSEPFSTSVKQPLNLLVPIVENANAETKSEVQDKAWLLADTAGAYVRIPDAVTLPANAKVEMYWQGKHPEGQHIADTPVEGTERCYFIPPTAIAASMSHDESKRFPVFYRVSQTDEPYEDSFKVELRIEPLAQDKYPEVQCVQAQGNNTLKLSQVPPEGADLYLGGEGLPAWPFMAAHQLLTIEVTCTIFFDSSPVSTTVRNAVAVTEEEFNRKKIEAKLSYQFLNSLKRDEKFSILSKVSFDGGATWQPFWINNNITLTAS